MEENYKYMVAARCFTYNQTPYIEDALCGFVMQETSFPFVAVILDDASTDGEQDVIIKFLDEHFQEPFRREETDYATIICAYHKTNPNCQFAVLLLKYNHYSIKKSKFPYLSEWNDNAKYHAICEGDDYWTNPHKLQMQVDFLNSHDDFTLCCHNAKKLIVQNNTFRNFCEYESDREIKPYDAIHKWIIATASIMIRKEMDIKPSWEAQIYSGDYALILRCLYYGKIYYLHERMSVYRFNMSGTSMTALVQNNSFFVFEQHMILLESFLNAPNQKNTKEISRRIYYLKNEIKYNKTKNANDIKSLFTHLYYGCKKLVCNLLFPVLP